MSVKYKVQKKRDTSAWRPASWFCWSRAQEMDTVLRSSKIRALFLREYCGEENYSQLTKHHHLKSAAKDGNVFGVEVCTRVESDGCAFGFYLNSSIVLENESCDPHPKYLVLYDAISGKIVASLNVNPDPYREITHWGDITVLQPKDNLVLSMGF